MTIIEMVLALAHLSAEEDAKLNGRRNRENPAVTRMMPMTEMLVSGKSNVLHVGYLPSSWMK